MNPVLIHNQPRHSVIYTHKPIHILGFDAGVKMHFQFFGEHFQVTSAWMLQIILELEIW